MPEQHGFWKADEISSDEAMDDWDKGAEEFASFFGEDGDFYHKHMINPSLIDVLGGIEGFTILDLACGEGHFARKLTELAKGKVKIIGVDASENMIRIAKEKSVAFADCLSFQIGDARRLVQLEPNAFDMTICNMALMDIKEYEQVIAEISRILKPKGVFIFSILHPCFMTPRSGWIRDENGEKIGWKVDEYHLNLVWRWTIKGRMRNETYHFHRTLENYFAVLRDSGFVITDLREPVPSKELIFSDPEFAPDLKHSGFLVLKSMLLRGEKDLSDP